MRMHQQLYAACQDMDEADYMDQVIEPVLKQLKELLTAKDIPFCFTAMSQFADCSEGYQVQLYHRSYMSGRRKYPEIIRSIAAVKGFDGGTIEESFGNVLLVEQAQALVTGNSHETPIRTPHPEARH